MTLGAVLPAVGQGVLHFEAPFQWISLDIEMESEVAYFSLPRAVGDPEDGELFVYYFGSNDGIIEENLERWTNQMLQPDERLSSDVATTTSFEVANMAITVLDVPGIYAAEVQVGSAMRYYKRGYKLLVAVVETPTGPYFFKMTGPGRTVSEHESRFNALLASVSFD